MEQFVKINVVNNEGKLIGVLTISNSNANHFYSEEIIKNEFSLFNVPLKRDIDINSPIIYCQKIDYPDIWLLEEIVYDIKFESEIDGINVFPTLNKFPDSPLTIYESPKLYQGSLLFSSYVGKSYFDISLNGEIICKIPFEVRSRKMGYFYQFPIMIGEISKYASSLLFEFNSPLFQSFNLNNSKIKSSNEIFMLLEYLFRPENLSSTVEYLSYNLYSSLEIDTEEVPVHLASNINPNDLIDAFLDSKQILNHKKGFIPYEIKETTYYDNIDVNENRFFKDFLIQVQDLIYNLLENSETGYVNDKLKIYKKEIDFYLSQKFFDDISPMDLAPLNSQVLQKKEGYREILSYYLMLGFGFNMNWDEITDIFKGNEKKLFELYEYWCYFELIKIICEITSQKVHFEDIFTKGTWNKSLRKGIVKKFTYKNLKIDLYYNHLFVKDSYSVPLKPDYSIIIHKDDKKYIIHFDAKYKIDVNSESYKNEDISKMHTYKDAIINSIGAYVFYPGEILEIFHENDIESVGAFPLNPGGSDKERNEIKLFIQNLFDNII